MSSKKELVGFLKAITNVLSEMSEVEYEELLHGRGKLIYIGNDHAKQQKNSQDINTKHSATDELVVALNQMNSRDEAMKYLSQTNILKNDLIRLAVALDIYINKSDSKEKITEKIVESTIGLKVRSKAIRETRLKHVIEVPDSTDAKGDLKNYNKG
ncbi:hypothetical protein [Paenibacillus sp. CR_12]|uniref:hypothetical protein n=1 Tax=Paenibacillus sp. CR_12 TaxID=3055793 RepID=UPI0035BEBC38